MQLSQRLKQNWHSSTYKLIITLVSENAAVEHMEVKNGTIACGLGNKKIKIWEASTLSYILTINCNHNILCMAMNDEFVIAGLGTFEIKIWKIENGLELNTTLTRELTGKIVDLRLHGNSLATQDLRGAIKVWTIDESGQILFQKQLESSVIYRFLEIDREFIVGVSLHGVIDIWRTSNFEFSRRFENISSALTPTGIVNFIHNIHYYFPLVVIFTSNNMFILDIETGELAEGDGDFRTSVINRDSQCCGKHCLTMLYKTKRQAFAVFTKWFQISKFLK